MKIHGWPADAGGCAWYRIETPLGTLTDDEVEIGVEMPNTVMDEPDTLVVLQRSCTPMAMMVLDEFQQKRRPWVYDIDDLLWNLTPDNPAFGYYIQKHVGDRLRWHLKNAPLLTVSTPNLADEAIAEGAEWVAVVPNTLPDRLFDYAAQVQAEHLASPPSGDDRTIILWRGSPTHVKDIEVARYALTRLARREDVRLVLAGADYRKELGIPHAEHLPWVDNPEAYVRQIINLAPDIALCPLEHTRFNRSKSHVNALEASIAGAVPVCSNVPAYNGLITHGENGVLLKGSPDTWWKALRSLVDDPTTVRAMGSAARVNAERLRASNMKEQYRDLIGQLASI